MADLEAVLKMGVLVVALMKVDQVVVEVHEVALMMENLDTVMFVEAALLVDQELEQQNLIQTG